MSFDTTEAALENLTAELGVKALPQFRFYAVRGRWRQGCRVAGASFTSTRQGRRADVCACAQRAQDVWQRTSVPPACVILIPTVDSASLSLYWCLAERQGGARADQGL